MDCKSAWNNVIGVALGILVVGWLIPCVGESQIQDQQNSCPAFSQSKNVDVRCNVGWDPAIGAASLQGFDICQARIKIQCGIFNPACPQSHPSVADCTLSGQAQNWEISAIVPDPASLNCGGTQPCYINLDVLVVCEKWCAYKTTN